MPDSVNVQDILSTRAENVKQPKNMPAGHYAALCVQREFVESPQKKTKGVRFHYKAESPDADVATQDLEGINLAEMKPHADFWLTPDALYRVVDVAKAHGIATDGRTISELIEMIPGTRAKIQIVLTPSKKEEGRFYSNVGRIVPL